MLKPNPKRVHELKVHDNQQELLEAIRSDRAFQSQAERREERKKKRKEMNVNPTLFIVIGGSGREVMLRTKDQLRRSGIVSFCRFVLIDTDPTARAGAGKLEGASDEEWVHCSSDRASKVIENFEKEPMIAERFDLADQAQRESMASVSKSHDDQAGQHRPRGALALLCNYDRVRIALNRAVTDLTGIYGRLEQFGNDGNQPNVCNRINVFIVFSAAGGTGSSMAVDVAALLSDIAQSKPLQITPIIIAPSVFENALAPYPEQKDRADTNGYSEARDIDAFNLGFGDLHRIRLGKDARETVGFPTGLFNSIFYVERILSDGTDLRTPAAVYDMVALHLVALVGTSLADRIACEDANQATLRTLTADPDTRKLRNWSTLGATAITFSARRIAKLFTYKQLLLCLRTCVGAESLGVVNINAVVDGWLSQCLNGKSMLNPADDLPAALLGRVRVDVSKFVNPLFKNVTERGRSYGSYNAFRQRVAVATNQLKETWLPSFSRNLESFSDEFRTLLESSLTNRTNELHSRSGIVSAIEFLTELIRRLKVAISKLENDARSDQKYGDSSVASIFDHRPSLITRTFTRCAPQQDTMANSLKDGVLAQSRARAKLQSMVILTGVYDIALAMLEGFKKSKIQHDQRIQKFRQLVVENSHGNRVCAEGAVEIDLSTPELEARIFSKLRLDDSQIQKLMENRLKLKTSVSLNQLMVQPGGFAVLERSVTEHFQRHLDGISIVDVLYDLASDPKSSAMIKGRMREAIAACKPAWRAEPGRLEIKFADSLTIGLPEGESEQKHKAVAEWLRKLAEGSPQPTIYTVSISDVVTLDPHRIYFIRRTHGGRPHYLKSFQRQYDQYRRWNACGKHSVDVFSRSVVAKMPSLMPGEVIDPVELTLAFGLAMGGVALRGGTYYWNMNCSELEDANRYSCKMSSHWNGLAFIDGNLKLHSELSRVLLDSGRLTYGASQSPALSDKLGTNLTEAATSLSQRPDLVKMMLDCLADLRAMRGDKAIAKMLDDYVSSLAHRLDPSHQDYEASQSHLELLKKQRDLIG